MKPTCIIPARGGSKRIPGKNTKLFMGKPIMAYSIEVALESGLFERVVVSTDSEAIAGVATSYGAETPYLRSGANSTDRASTVDVLREVHQQLGIAHGVACCLYATAPFVTVEVLRAGWERLNKEELDGLFPVQPFSAPIQRAMKVDGAGLLRMFSPEHQYSRSQDLEMAYRDCGMFYWYRAERILTGKGLYDGRVAGLQLTEMEAHDIDTPEDWEVAEFKYRFNISNVN